MDEDFLRELYIEMYPKLYQYARVKLGDRQLAQELAQDVFVLAQEKIDSLRQSPNPKGWLIKAAGYAVLHAQRTKKLLESRLLPLDESLAAAPTEPEEYSLRELMSREDWRLLSSVYLEGRSIKETAELCGLSLEACRKRLFRIKRRLRKKLGEDLSIGKGGEGHDR